MLHVSHETPAETEARLLRVMAEATVCVFDEAYAFEEYRIGSSPPALDESMVAAVRDAQVWSYLRPAPPGSDKEGFGLVRFHFPEGVDNSGFVGWLASHLKRTVGTGVFVICGQNSGLGGIFDYTGFPAALRESVLKEIEALRRSGALLVDAGRARHQAEPEARDR